MEDYTTNYTIRFSENWFGSITSTIIHLYGIQIIETDTNGITYEGVIFDDISKCKYYVLCLFNNKDESTTICHNIDKFEIVSDTCIRFKLPDLFSTENHEFILLIWN